TGGAAGNGAAGAEGSGRTVPTAGARGGLRMRRVWTTPGRHPYDEVTWERRDVVMTNWRDGSVNFEQRGVEFPATWSMNATQIVASKYFRGALGTPQREWSLKQLIDRVVRTYRAAGEEHGYFASPDDAQVFADELTYLLLHQYFSLNSQVWVNVGTPSPQQFSAGLGYDTLVSTPAGLVPIGELVERDAVGAKVYDAAGVTKIVATKANGVREVIRLHTRAGYTLDLTDDHLVWASGRGFVPAGTLRPGDRLEWHRRDSYGEREIDLTEVAEAGLAGWLYADGLVDTDPDGVVTIEVTTVRDEERRWLDAALATGFNAEAYPDLRRDERVVAQAGRGLDARRLHLRDRRLQPFLRQWGLPARPRDLAVPARLFTAPAPAVAAYLRGLFAAEGYVTASGTVGVALPSGALATGVQHLLLRFGIFASRREAAGRSTVSIRGGDREVFAREIGFVDADRTSALEAALGSTGARDLPGVRPLEITRVEPLGPQEVYDIQTESGEFLAANLRVHNCFILSVDDSMESILDWYKEEGLIFKGGSGAGVNLSRIRSSKELLSSGGTASGPVSFMRGADASAGTIKSGGATRRAAKM